MKRQKAPKTHSLQMQLFGITAIFICVGSVLIMIANSHFIPAYYLAKQRSLIRDIGVRVEEIATESRDFYNDIAFVERDSDIDVEIYNAAGSIVFDSVISGLLNGTNNDPQAFFNLGVRSHNMTAVRHEEDKSGGFFEIRKDTRFGTEYLVYGRPIKAGGAVLVYSRLNYNENKANASTRTVSLIACATFMLIILTLYFCVRHMTNPLSEMNRITRAMAKMDFSQKCPPYLNNEIGELGRSINTLSASLDETLRDLQEKNKRLEEDIEHERKLEKMRKAFVSNASHELKTPIAIIQGYAEGIKLGVKSQSVCSEDYCDIIIEETHKMNSLVCGMLELSKYESGTYVLDKRRFDIGEFVAQSIDTYGILAGEKGITLQTDVPHGIYGYGDPDKLDMVLHNYVSNALSHAKGEKLIRIFSEDCGDTVRISVFNTGDGINEADMESLWQSFYRADKAHSRSEGRFGLGLSIVKAIQELHDMPYSVTNVDGGVVFTFDIKKDVEE